MKFKDHISFDYRQINIAPNGEFNADKKEVAEYPDDCYLYIQRECEIDGVISRCGYIHKTSEFKVQQQLKKILNGQA